jgi:NAD(P)H-hydrate epimerase
MAGAAILAARAALRGGAGFLRVASPPANREILQTAVPEAVFVDASDQGAMTEAIAASRALAIGPGLGTGEEGAGILEGTLKSVNRQSILLDADALNILAGGPGPGLTELPGDVEGILTPHPGEMARLMDIETGEVTRDRPNVARKLAEEQGCAVLLKGMPSLVAAPGGRILVDTVASSDLAAAGMGDVLAGVVASFLAQGSSALEAGALGLFTSGRAAARAALGVSLTPEDVVEALPGALQEEGNGDTELDFPFLLFDQDPAR